MPSEFTLYHNPRCSKSRAALALLEEKGVAADVVKYLDMFAKLGIESVRGMMRTKDDLYKELGLDNPDLDNAALLQAIAEHPALLERPVLVTPTRAAIGRPLENIAALLG